MGGGAGASVAPTAAVTPETPQAPAGQVLLQVDVAPGFVPYEYVLATRPFLTVYGDGRVIVTHSVKGWPDFVGQPVPLRLGQLDAATVRRLVEQWRSSGAFSVDKPNFGSPAVTDLPTTVLRMRDGSGHLVQRSIYALDTGFGAIGLTSSQQRLRSETVHLISRTQVAVGRTTAYIPQRVSVIQLHHPVPSSRAPHGTREWPGPALRAVLQPQTDGSPCATLRGSVALSVLRAAEDNPSLSWRDGQLVHRLVVRALLPREPGCG